MKNISYLLVCFLMLLVSCNNKAINLVNNELSYNLLIEGDEIGNYYDYSKEQHKQQFIHGNQFKYYKISSGLVYESNSSLIYRNFDSIGETATINFIDFYYPYKIEVDKFGINYIYTFQDSIIKHRQYSYSKEKNPRIYTENVFTLNPENPVNLYQKLPITGYTEYTGVDTIVILNKVKFNCSIFYEKVIYMQQIENYQYTYIDRKTGIPVLFHKYEFWPNNTETSYWLLLSKW